MATYNPMYGGIDAGQAQANTHRNAFLQASNPMGFAAANPASNSQWSNLLKTDVPQWLKQFSSTPMSVGGLFDQPLGMPTMPQLGGLMDFNALASQLAGDPGQMSAPGMPAINAVQPDSMFQNMMLNPGQFLFPSRGYGVRNPRANIGVRG